MGIESSGIKISADLIKNKLLQEIKSEGTTVFYTNSGKPQHHGNKNSKQSKPKGPRCFNCNKYGHISSKCWFKNKKTDDDKKGFVAAFSASMVNEADSWYVDSGASSHMTMCRSWLQDEATPTIKSIRVANGKTLQVESSGNVPIKVINHKTGNVEKILIKNVLMV
ncbi:uncharacterized protein LOC125490289 [Plutella xylostella]|uniref:uncharacterized protein LOC125490289 n=1 Tax=Plutella xylostella TaxID=51655 RepID=UPI0020328359|nr:uncharacterized protein LOC125490289 [Plutella xylostella]